MRVQMEGLLTGNQGPGGFFRNEVSSIHIRKTKSKSGLATTKVQFRETMKLPLWEVLQMIGCG